MTICLSEDKKDKLSFFGDYEKIGRKINWNLYQIDDDLAFLDITQITQWCGTLLCDAFSI